MTITNKPQQTPGKTWRQAAGVFHDRAAEYDSWYDDSLLFNIELAALLAVSPSLHTPKLEIGAGPGRFAGELGVTVGVDPALAALQLGNRRGIMGTAGIGEQLPIRSDAIGTVFLLFTLCFLIRPEEVLQECARVLRKNGRLVIGLIPKNSAWGKMLDRKRREGHAYYKYAHFISIWEATNMLTQCGFSVTDARSTLFQPPEELRQLETPKTGINEQAGFCVLVAEKKKTPL
ncbi:MAG: methyltransferase domain-containing protein [Desulfobulbaceae bacterium]|nr:methyltransferase domain-containing protein [Desulfobulbaceae bacterium]